MMPPLNPIPPEDIPFDCVPYPGSELELGGGRWLTETAQIITEPRGCSVLLTPRTRKYWEGRALVALMSEPIV